MKKFILSMVICTIIAVCISIPAYAAEMPEDNINTTVEYVVNDYFTASIPAYIIASGQEELSADCSVTINNVMLPERNVLTATVEYNGILAENNGVELPYELNTETGVSIQSGTQILAKESGSPNESLSFSFGAHLTDKPKYSGIYTDTVTFSFSVIEKAYTAEDIASDDRIYGIGATRSEYVIAKFNDDFSFVEIFKNGDQSDGIMRNLTFTTSPMSKNAATLKSAHIHEGVKNISNCAFMKCEKLEAINFPESITTIGTYAFASTALSIVEFKGNNLKTIGDFSFGEIRIKELCIPEGVKEIGEWAFRSCPYLEKITLPSTLSTLGTYVFAQCYSLQSCDIPANCQITKIPDHCFYDCNNLSAITLPEGLISIENGAFYLCFSLDDIIIPSTVTQIDTQLLKGFKNIFVKQENQNYMDINGILFSKTGDALIFYPSRKPETEYIIPEGVTTILPNAFDLCRFQSITFPDSISTLKSNIFSNCKNLRNIYGTAGSYAETFAAEYGYNFIIKK